MAKFVKQRWFVSSILMNLSKAYDFLKDYTLLAKLQAYSFSKKHKIILKLSNEFSDRKNIAKGIPQGSILDLLLFNIFINELLFFSVKCEFSYFADDNSLCSCGMNLDNTFTNLIQNE